MPVFIGLTAGSYEREIAMPLQVVNATNQIMCPAGVTPTPLIVTTNQTVFGTKQLCATIMDCAPITNIVPFGVCSILTAAASGVPTPCVPAPAGPWQTGSPTTKHQKIPALRQCDKLQCTVGGMISVLNPGQMTYDID